jgi:hypothetical protein
LGQFLVFGLFAVGINIAVFTGLFARTGASEPELTTFLGAAVILGSVSIFFFQLIFPLWGVWAAVRTLCGRNHRYPILGRLAINWSSRWPTDAEASSDRELNPENLNSETVEQVPGHRIRPR